MLAFKSKYTEYILLEDYLSHSILDYFVIKPSINSALIINEKSLIWVLYSTTCNVRKSLALFLIFSDIILYLTAQNFIRL